MPPLVAPALALALLMQAASPGEAAWSLDPSWDDGRAEVARYDARRTVYGVTRSFDTVILTVKEEMDLRTGVKADPPLEGRPLATVLKTNILSSIPAGNYTYHYMTSAFSRRDDPLTLLKLSQSSQEWCGTTFKEVIAWDGTRRIVRHSYFDGQADGETPLRLGRDALLEEQLLSAVRGMRPPPGEGLAFDLYDTLVTHTAEAPVARTVRAHAAGTGPLATPAGSFTARRIDLRLAEARAADPPLMSFWIEEAPRSALLAFEAADGRSLRLKSIERRDYWSRR
jgi:hypothetical protein